MYRTAAPTSSASAIHFMRVRGVLLTGVSIATPPALSPSRQQCHLSHRQVGRRGARLDTELFVDILEVLLHRRRARADDVADGAVGLALDDPVPPLGLAQGQLEAGPHRL